MGNSGEDDESFVTIGTPFDIPEDNEVLHKPVKVTDQIAVDKQGRRRFHGAFTGGFSAGYYNSVGSKEGWAPSTFKSSRSSKNENKDKSESRPEDFMDEDDFAEHGIAPRILKTNSKFESTEKELHTRKRHIQKVIDDDRLAIIPGLPLDDLILPAKLSIGIKLLKAMGWKPGQGIGEKVDAMIESFDKTLSKKVYGCSMPSSTNHESLDMASLTGLLAPKDIHPFLFSHKDNIHGIGYSGIDPHTAMFGGTPTREQALRPTGKEKKGIKGQAFGVGVFEDEDEDIYSSDNLSNYDLTMGEEDASSTHGWTGAPKSQKYSGCLHGFTKSLKKVTVPKFQKMLSLPTGYIPKHIFSTDQYTGNKSSVQDEKCLHQQKLSSKDRSLLLGETTKGLEDVNQWSLKWDTRPAPKDDTTGRVEDKTEKIKRISPRWDNSISQKNSKQMEHDHSIASTNNAHSSTTNNTHLLETSHTVPVPADRQYSSEADSTHTSNYAAFKPFAKCPEKQMRYESFLATRKSGKKPCLTYDRSVTEWERDREIDEFTRAAILYQPLTSMFANRFTRATEVTTNIDENRSTSNVEVEEDKPDDKKAAEMGMFGKLTRNTIRWHPEKLLCKRFNIPDPYPNSKVKGVPGRGKKSRPFFSDTRVKEDVKSLKDEEEVFEVIKKQSNKPLNSIGPLSHLNNQSQKIIININNINKEVQGKTEIEKKPSLDIFKAIFENSDSSSSSEEEYDIEKENVQDKKVAELSNAKDDIKIAPIALKTTLEDEIRITPVDIKTTTDESEVINTNTNSVKNKKQDLPLAFLNTKADLAVSKSEKGNVLNKKTFSIDKQMHNDNRYRDVTSTETRENIKSRYDEKRSSTGLETRTDKRNIVADSWEEIIPTKKKSKKHKKEKKKKRKTIVQYHYSDSMEEESSEKIKSKKHKKHKKKEKRRKSESSSSSEEETVVPSNAELFEKLKRYTKSMKRPSAADFM